MSYDPLLRTALSGQIVHLFVAVEITHPVKTIRLLDGDGFLTINGNVFRGFDPEIGVLGAMSSPEDGVGDQAPTLGLSINPINDAVGIALCVPSAQGASVKGYFGAFDPQTGLVVGEPYVWFVGEIDVPNLPIDSEAPVTFDCISGFERFFEADEDMLLSNAFHQSVFPGERGLEYVTGIEMQMPWGTDGARPKLSRAA